MNDFVVARLDPICRQLAEVKDAPQAKRVADLARAAEVYARRQKLGDDAIRHATAIKIDALTLMGELLLDGPKNNGCAGPGRGHTGEKPNSQSERGFRAPTLAEMGIPPKESMNAQALVKIQQSAPDIHRKVRDGDMTVTRARLMLARQRDQAADKPTHTPPVPATVYRCIVADPPWPMKKSEREPRPDQGPALPYATMTVDAVEALPVATLSDPEGCHLYLWVTHRFLPDGLRVMAAWGFRYHCLLTWVKPSGMTPFSWMFNTEHVLFGYAGRFETVRPGLKVSFEAPAPRGGHSTKPDVFFDRVREFSVGPRLEMFARGGVREGFDAWGNEL